MRIPGATDSSDLRTQNRLLVLRALRSYAELSHTEISKITGVSSATVSAITTQLEAEGALARPALAEKSGRGRPRVLFTLNPQHAYVVIARVTSEMLEYSLVDYAGRLQDRYLLKREQSSTPRIDLSSLFKTGINHFAGRSGLAQDKIKAISISSKGLVARDQPILLWSPLVQSDPVDFEEVLKNDWPHSYISLTNETRFAAEAISLSMAADESSFVPEIATLSLDHSIGLGVANIAADGTISSTAPAFGHMNFQVDGPLCRCGARGCIEAYAGFYGLLRTAFDAPEQSIPANFVPFEEIQKIAQRAQQGDHRSQYAFRIAGEAIGTGMSHLFSILGHMPIAITGRGVGFFHLMQESFEKALSNNFRGKFEPAPTLSTFLNEDQLIFDGNSRASLSRLDAEIVAPYRDTKEEEIAS